MKNRQHGGHLIQLDDSINCMRDKTQPVHCLEDKNTVYYIDLKLTATGANSVIYRVHNKEGQSFIAKMITSNPPPKDVVNEICNQMICAQQGFAPVVYDAFFCQKRATSVIIMYNAGNMTARQYIDLINNQTCDNLTDFFTNANYIFKICYKMVKKITLLPKIGLVHGDCHMGNIMCSVDGYSVKEVKFIDFGLSRKIKDFQNHLEHIISNYQQSSVLVDDELHLGTYNFINSVNGVARAMDKDLLLFYSEFVERLTHTQPPPTLIFEKIARGKPFKVNDLVYFVYQQIVNILKTCYIDTLLDPQLGLLYPKNLDERLNLTCDKVHFAVLDEISTIIKKWSKGLIDQQLQDCNDLISMLEEDYGEV